ncbi:MAG: ABC transporter ATP-binding protein [Gemmatimonadales bacterium]
MSPIVQVDGLVKEYVVGGGLLQPATTLRAVDGVSCTIEAGETLGLVGESGSGKSTLGRLIVRLEEPTAGTVRFEGTDLGALDAEPLRRARRRMQLVFQDPLGALNPRYTVGWSIAEGLVIHGLGTPAEHPARVAELLAEVGLDPDLARRLPHELSGGQRQRIGIARALAVEPTLLVCDEPVSALDVSTRAQVLGLLRTLRDRHALAILFIAHDLAVVHALADRVAVMYLGTIVEIGPTHRVIGDPRHPYTRALVSAVPHPDPTRRPERIVLTGEPPSPTTRHTGCPFAARCFHPDRDARCTAERPMLRDVGGREVACHHAT